MEREEGRKGQGVVRNEEYDECLRWREQWEREKGSCTILQCSMGKNHFTAVRKILRIRYPDRTQQIK